MASSLSDKNILVTGASRGLGRALCVGFARQGARVAFTYGRDDDGAAETLAAVEAVGTAARAFKVSVLDGPGTRKMLNELDKDWGTLDVLVNNAGVNENLPLALLDEHDWDKVLDTNLKGAFLMARAVLRLMIKRKSGVVLNIGSLAGARMLEAPIHYCASKAGLVGMTEAMAKEVGRHGIRLICLAPGLLEDGMGRNLPPHRLEAYLHHCSLGRIGRYDEVADFAAFLVSDANGFMHGETVIMDGGV